MSDGFDCRILPASTKARHGRISYLYLLVLHGEENHSVQGLLSRALGTVGRGSVASHIWCLPRTTKATIDLVSTHSIRRTARFGFDLAGWYPTFLPERSSAVREGDSRTGPQRRQCGKPRDQSFQSSRM